MLLLFVVVVVVYSIPSCFVFHMTNFEDELRRYHLLTRRYTDFSLLDKWNGKCKVTMTFTEMFGEEERKGC